MAKRKLFKDYFVTRKNGFGLVGVAYSWASGLPGQQFKSLAAGVTLSKRNASLAANWSILMSAPES